MKKWQRYISALLCVLLLAALLPAAALAESDAELNDAELNKSISIKESEDGLALCAGTAMLLRRAAIREGAERSVWRGFTESYVRTANGGAAIPGSQSYTVGGFGYTVKAYRADSIGESGWASLLGEHPEGVVLRFKNDGTDKEKGLLLAKYENGTFFCLDPDPAAAGGLIDAVRSGYGKSEAGGSKTKLLNAVTYYYAVSSPIDAHTHSFGTSGEALGVCSGCGYNYYLDHQIPLSGKAVPAAGLSAFSLKLSPYSASDYLRENGELLRFTSVNVTAVTENQYGNVWYLVESPDKKYSGYVWEDNLTVSSSSSVIITGVTVPENNAVEGNGARTEITGTARANGTQLTGVTAAVYAYDSLGSDELKSVLNNSLTASSARTLAKKRAEVYGSADDIESSEFELSALAPSVRFDRLEGGRTYLYVVTATDTNGNRTTVYRSFYLGRGAETKRDFTVRLSVAGSVSERTVTGGGSLKLPEASRTGYLFLGWAEGESGGAEYAPGTSFTPESDVTLYAVFEKISAPPVPKLTCSVKDAAVGETVSLQASASGAERFTVYIYEGGSLIRTQSFTSGKMGLAFEKEGTYTVEAEAFTGDSGSGRSKGVTFTVHAPVLVTFMDGDTVWAEQRVDYGGTAAEPPVPAHPGSTFIGWDGSLENMREDTRIYASFASGAYTVTFTDEDGRTLSRQQVPYNGSADAPEAPGKPGMAFLGWSSDAWQHVTEDGLTVSPVYVLAADEESLACSITKTETAGSGTLVTYTVSNESDALVTGRVQLSGRTASGEKAASSAGSLFLLLPGEEFRESVYVSGKKAVLWEIVPFGTDEETVLGAPALYLSSGDGETTLWATADELKKLGGSYKKIEEAKQYSTAGTETYTTPASSFLDWDKKSGGEETVWGAWSDWQTEPVSADKNRQVEKRQVVTVPAHVEYRYGRWYGENVTRTATGERHEFGVSPSQAYAKTVFSDAAKKFTKQFTPWSTARFTESETFKSKYADNQKTYVKAASGAYIWNVYYIGAASENNAYFWEESRRVAEETVTQYRYRVRAEGGNSNVFTHQKEAVWSFASAKNAKTRTVLHVRFSGAAGGDTVTLSGSLGFAAANRDAILTVVMSDGAGHENVYTEKLRLGSGGEYRAEVADMSGLTAIGAPCYAYLTPAGSTDRIRIGSFTSSGKTCPVRFADGLTGELMSAQTVNAGDSAEAPEANAHEGYLFTGWSRTPSNITEDTVITAEYEKETFTVIFSDSVAGKETAVPGVPYGSPVEIPAESKTPGYTFMGWSVPAGCSLSSVTEPMRAEAVYEEDLHIVTYLSAPSGYDSSGNAQTEVLAEVQVRDGAYLTEPWIEGNMHVPDGMYFLGWSEGAAEPVTADLILVPVLGCILDAEDVVPSQPGGVYASGTKLTLHAADTRQLIVRYRFNTASQAGDWKDYDIRKSPSIELTSSGELEIESLSPGKNTKRFTYAYTVSSGSGLPAAPTMKSVTQTSSSELTVTWTAVKNAKGYILTRTSDCGEVCTQMLTGTTYADKGVVKQRTYTYSVSAYVMNEKNGTSFLLEGNASKPVSARFYGSDKLVRSISVKGQTVVYVDSSIQLEAFISPSDATEKNVYWTVDSGSSHALVSSDGLLTGLSAGEVTVSARATDGSGVSGSMKVTVKTPESNAATLSVSTTGARAGNTAQVAVALTKNPGVKSVRFTVRYNASKLTLSTAKKGTLMTGVTPGINVKTNGYVTFTYDGSSLTDTGTLLVLTFNVKSSATGSAYVQIASQDDGYELALRDRNAKTMTVTVQNGSVNVSGMQLGDVNDDGVVDVEDAFLVRSYIGGDLQMTDEEKQTADVNGDGKVNSSDITLIREYIVKKITTFPAED